MKLHVELLSALAGQGGLVGLALLHLAAGKLPQERPAAAWEALLHQEVVVRTSPAAKSVAIRMLEGTKQGALNGDGLETNKASSP